MPLFKISSRKLDEIKEVSFQNERELQKITEENLPLIFGLKFVASEFELNSLRIDSLAFDDENNSFVIIEYKIDRNYSVIDQGYAYLSLLLNNKADFVLKYNRAFQKNKGKEDVDWSQSRVLFVSPAYTRYQQKAMNFRDLPMQLWEVKKYSNDTLLYNQLVSEGNAESINTISKHGTEQEKVSKEVKVYTEEDHLNRKDEGVLELYNALKEQILLLDDAIKISPQKFYIAFKKQTNFIDIEVQKAKLKMHLNLKKGMLNDPQKIARDVSNVGHYGNGDYEIILTDKSQASYVILLIKQALDKNN